MTALSLENTESTYKLEEQVGFMLRLAGQRHANIFQEESPLNLTPTQFSALVKLLHLGECSQNELGRRTAVDVATIKGVIDRLRRRGLVEVSPDPKDKRRSLLKPVKSDLEFLRLLHEAGRQITERTLMPLTASERKTFLSLLHKLI
jgi:DNA-binding MarR family transcriptional regulator